ncbi:MAG: VWA domain-containing protein [Actinomycetota bacterium]|nr:VWA domain-containing protein [Actinomycetota bacterium]
MGTLLDRHVGFVVALREAGLIVSVAESLDAVRAMDGVELLDREQLRAGLAATLVKRQLHRRVFDTVFDLFYPAVTGESAKPATDREPAPRGPDAAPRGPLEDPRRDAVREMLADYLREGQPADLEGAVRDAVDAFGTVPGRASAQSSWSQLAVLSKVNAQTLMAGLLEQLLAGHDRGGLAERRARTMVNDRIARWEQAVRAEVGRRLAELSDAETVARFATRPSIDRVSFLGANRTELAALRREIQPLARRLAARLAIDQRKGRRGHFDFRATMRSSLSTGGVPMQTKHRPKRPLKTDLVVICDLSESVTSFAHFTLLFVYALREQFSRVRAFGFVDELDELTRFFTPGADVVESVTRLTEQADVTWLLGRTDYGRAFELFAKRFPDAVGPKTSLLILGDARSNYGALALPTLTELAGRAKNAYWLNPERRSAWDTGDSRASDFDRVVPMVECRNLAQLSAFVRDLAD